MPSVRIYLYNIDIVTNKASITIKISFRLLCCWFLGCLFFRFFWNIEKLAKLINRNDNFKLKLYAMFKLQFTLYYTILFTDAIHFELLRSQGLF